MRLRCYLRYLRGDRTLRSAAARIGIAPGDLSMLERGHCVPKDDLVPVMELVYGPREAWYPRTLARSLAPDIRRCPVCDEELPPEASRSRVYHEGCRP